MFLRNYVWQKIQTVKILKCDSVDDKFGSAAIDDKNDSKLILEIELKMRNGSTQNVKVAPRLAFKKYHDFFHNHKDENWHHNEKMIRQNNLLDIYEEDIIPMHENPNSDNSKCIMS